LYEISFQAAKKAGFDEAVILNELGYITEGTRSNIFFIKDKQLCTPALTCGCLPGITRQAVFALAKECHLDLCEGKFTLRDLAQAEEAFLTNSLMGVMPLTSLNRQSIGQRKCAKITKIILKKYHCLLK
jgi:branched-subunit amino acid aminotransferase/4-amino-4-deoxychorismate lyase